MVYACAIRMQSGDYGGLMETSEPIRCDRSGRILKVIARGPEFKLQCGACGRHLTIPVVDGKITMPEH
jgi:hypothetical protein